MANPQCLYYPSVHPPKPSKPTRSWLGSRRPPWGDKTPTSENPLVSGGFRKTSYGSVHHLSYQTAVWKGKKKCCDDEGRDDCLAEPLWADELEGRRRLDWDDDDEALRCGLKSDRSRAADLADSADEASKREPVWKNGSESRFLFWASETEGPHEKEEASSSSWSWRQCWTPIQRPCYYRPLRRTSAVGRWQGHP